MKIDIYTNPDNMIWDIGSYRVSVAFGYNMHGTHEDIFGPRTSYRSIYSVEVMVRKDREDVTSEFFPNAGNDPAGYVNIADLIDLLAKIKAMV